MGCKALRVSKLEDLDAKMKEFMEYDNDKPIVMECDIVQTEHGSYSWGLRFRLLNNQLTKPLFR